MIERPTHAIRATTAVARRYAALSGPFEPRGLTAVIGKLDPEPTLTVAADLAEACDTRYDSNSARWLMRGSVRQRVLSELAASGTLEGAIEWRRSLPLDEATTDLLDALAGSAPFSERAIRVAINEVEARPRSPSTRSSTVGAGSARDRLERLAVALDRAGPHAPAHAALDVVRAALGRVELRSRADAVLDQGFFGRTEELARISDWLARPIESPPIRALFISGLPGIGKSTLIDEAARRALDATPPWILVRLDFDRAALDVQDRVGLTMEIARQVSVEIAEHAGELRAARLAEAGESVSSEPSIKGEAREGVPAGLGTELGEAVRDSGRPVLLIADTLEILRGRAETHPGRLFDCLDQLSELGLGPLAVVAAGRGDALDSAKERIGDRIDLPGLDIDAARALLNRLDVPTEAITRILELADGNPLVLRLAARAVLEAGPAALRKVRGQRELAAAYLYRFLLSRIANPLLRRLARPGLIVRRINADVIGELLAPRLRIRLEPGQAQILFEALATHHWLVEPDPSAPGWVRHRADIRSVLLRLLYRDGEQAAVAIDRAAAHWFDRRSEPFAPLEATYHRLQAMRRGGELPSLDPEIVRRFDAETIAELPREAQDHVHRVRGERTSEYREAAAAPPLLGPEQRRAAARELLAILERGDVVEAHQIHEQAFAGATLDPLSEEADAVRTFLWRAGRWEAALESHAERITFEPGAGSFLERDAAVVLAHLEMRAEADFAELVRLFEQEPSVRGFAEDLRARGYKGALANGALGFALLAAGGALSKASWDPYDPVRAAEAVWAPATATTSPADALSGAFRRLQARIQPGTAPAPDPSNLVWSGRLLATLSPYGSVVESVQRLDSDGRVLRHLAAVDFGLAEVGGLTPAGFERWILAPAVTPEASVESLTSLGLLAEWLGAAALALEHADLRHIAEAAERWRRTVAGQWAYPTPDNSTPPPWSRDIDVTIEDRVAGLGGFAAQRDAASVELVTWWGKPDTTAGQIEAQIAEHFETAVAGGQMAARAGGARAAAIELIRRGMPSAFVPPLAALWSEEREGLGR